MTYSFRQKTKSFDATVVVPAYNAAATLPACLKGLLAQTAPRLDIVVVDDGSTDQTAALAASYGVRVLTIPHQGAAAARNAGVEAAHPTAPYILFTDADCVPSLDWAAQLITALRQASDEVAGVKGIYKTRQRELVARFAQAEYDDRYRRFRHTAAPLDFADTYSAGFRKTVLEEFPFETALPGAIVEDAELGWRLRQAGYSFEFAPQAVVYHHHLTDWRKYFRRKYRIACWRVVLYRTYPGQLPKDSHTSQAAKLQMVLLTLALPLAVIGPTKALRRLGLAGLVLLELSYARFVKQTWPHDRAAALAAGPLLHLRTLSQICGMVTGAVKLGRVRLASAQRRVIKILLAASLR